MPLRELIIKHRWDWGAPWLCPDPDEVENHVEYLAPLVEIRGRIGKFSVIQSPKVQKSVGLQRALGVIEGIPMPYGAVVPRVTRDPSDCDHVAAYCLA